MSIQADLSLDQPFSKKQVQFICESTASWNLAHGAVSTGKTVGSLFAFMLAVDKCQDSQIWMIGHTSDTIYHNCIRLIMESPQLSIFAPFCSWSPGKRQLSFKDKVISTIGANNAGSIGAIQGKTMSLAYCDEMTLYPDNIIEMIDSRLRLPWSRGFASMNPSNPGHILRKWIDEAEAGNPKYYALHFVLDDNPFLPPEYVQRMKDSKTGLFYRRYILGEWCLAEGAIFDFFDRKIHVVPRPPRAANYWVAGIDYGTANSFACVLIGVNNDPGLGAIRWVEKEYIWDSRKTERQKSPSEYADDVAEFLEPYAIQGVYLDPSAVFFKLELAKRGIHCVPTENDVLEGIMQISSELKSGKLVICAGCKGLIKEIEGYCWDSKKSEKGEDAPIKKDDHAVDALKYSLSHKIIQRSNYTHSPSEYQRSRFAPTRSF